MVQHIPEHGRCLSLLRVVVLPPQPSQGTILDLTRFPCPTSLKAPGPPSECLHGLFQGICKRIFWLPAEQLLCLSNICLGVPWLNNRGYVLRDNGLAADNDLHDLIDRMVLAIADIEYLAKRFLVPCGCSFNICVHHILDIGEIPCLVAVAKD